MDRTPLKTKEIFANPAHRIRLAPFISAGFNNKTLDAVIKKFTDRTKKKLSIELFQKFIMNFTNKNPKLSNMYLDFLKSIRQKEPGFIEIEDFVEIFLSDNETDLTCLSSKKYEKLFKQFSSGDTVVTDKSLIQKSRQLGCQLTEKEAYEIVRYCSRTGKPEMDKYDFIEIMKST